MVLRIRWYQIHNKTNTRNTTNREEITITEIISKDGGVECLANYHYSEFW